MSTDENQNEAEIPAKILKKSMSLSQFKSWLEGVEEMQDETWHPSATQWKTIRDKFDLIAEPRPAPAVARAPAAGPMPVYQPPQPAAPTAWAPAPTMPEADISPAAKALLASGGQTPRTKTPDVDSADGTFESPFG